MARNPSPKSAAPEAAGADFEQSMTELERIVEELESGSLPLDVSLAHYEKGMALARRLTQTLDQAEKRIEKLVENEAGEPATEELRGETHAASKDSPEGELPL